MRERLWLLVFILLVACWLGARGLDYDTIWTDEFYSLRDAGLLDRLTGERIETPSTVAEIWNRVASGNPWHTPLYFVALSVWSRLFGFDPAVLRILALFFGLLTIAWTYRLGRDLFSPTVGLYAAFVMGTSAYFIYYFHEIRMYTFVTAFTAYMFWIYFQIISSKSVRPIHWIGLCGGAVLFLYTHYFATLPIGAIGIFHLVWGHRIIRENGGTLRRWWGVIAGFAVAAILYLPWITVLINGVSLTLEDEVLHSLALDNPTAMQWLIHLFSNGYSWLFLSLVLIASFGLRKRGVQYVFIFCVLLIAMVLLANQVLEIFKPSRIRYMILLWPLLALMVAVGVRQLHRWRIIAMLVLSVWVFGSLTGSAAPEFFGSIDAATYVYPLQEVAHYVREHQQADDYVLSYVPEDLRIARYDRLANYYFAGLPISHRNLGVIYETDTLMNALHAEAIQSLDRAERIWVAYMPDNAPPRMNAFIDLLDNSYQFCSQIADENQVNIALYTLSDVCCIPDAEPPRPTLQFGDWFTVVGSELSQSLDQQSLDAVISWNVAANAPLHTYSATIQLFDADGQVVGQTDYGITPSLYTCQRAMLNLTDLPPGTYEARLAVYNWQTGERLPARDLIIGTNGDLLPLGTITIES